MKVNRKYYEFIHNTFKNEDFCVLQGGKRAGKTFAVLQYIFLDLVQRNKRRALIVTDTFARLRDSILADFSVIMFEYPTTCKVIYSGTPRIDFYNGNSIMFLCADRDSRGFTSNKNYIFFNEAIMYPENVVRDALKAGADDCKVLFDYNPFTRFYVNEKYETATNKLITTYKDNPLCPLFARKQLEEQAERGKNASGGTLERYLYEVECMGANAELSGLVFPKAETVADDAYFNEATPEILASDWGQVLSTADPDVVIGVKFTADGRAMMHEYYYRNDGTDADISEVLKTIPFKRQPFVFETATAGEVRIRNIYNLCGVRFKFVPCSKGVGSVMIGIRNLQEYRLQITCSSLNIQREQRNYKYITKGDIIQPSDSYNHAFDCLRYAHDFYIGSNKRVK